MPICPTCLQQYAEGIVSCPSDGDALAPDAAYAYVDRPLAPGDRVGEYEIEGKLGEGGFGAVYRATHPVIGKAAAVKVLNRQFSSNPEMVSRFIAEARAVNQIRHKNIIDVFSFGQLQDGRQYYVMELLDGRPFDQYLAQEKRLSPAQAMPILRAVARAVDAAHAKGILHRDLKPDNVFLAFDDDGAVSVKLLDFGLVKLLGEASSAHKTKTGAPMGTPMYMSPEQVRGGETDARTDIYAFGAMIFEVFTGRVPFEGTSVMDILVKHLEDEVPSASALQPDLPPAIDDALRRLMAKEVSARPATMGEALDLVAAAAGLEVVQKTPHALPRPAASAPVSAPRPVSDGAEAHAQTFLASEADVANAPKPAKPSRVGIFAGVGVLAVLVVGGGVFVAASRSHGAGAGVVANANAGPPSGAASTSAREAPSTAASAAALPSTVALRIEGAPPGANVAIASKDKGPAPGPFAVARGEKVTVVVSAKGFKPRDIVVTPADDLTVNGALEKEKPGPDKPVGGGKPHGPSISGDLEGFDKKP